MCSSIIDYKLKSLVGTYGSRGIHRQSSKVQSHKFNTAQAPATICDASAYGQEKRTIQPRGGENSS